MRYLLVFVLGALAAAGGFFVYRHLTAGLPVVLPKPQRIQVTVPATGQLLPGNWTNARSLALSATSRSDLSIGADVEVRPVGQRFKNTPTASRVGCAHGPHCVAGDPSVTVHLANGHYHWQIRLHNRQGVSPWVAYPRAINIDSIPPTLPRVTSPTDPKPTVLYHSAAMTFNWQVADAGSGIAGYSYRMDTDPHAMARTELRTPNPTITLSGLDTGRWYFHVRALDRAGNWGPSATFPVRIDVTPPGLAHVHFNLFDIDPKFDSLRVSFAVTRPATTIRVGVYRQDDGRLIRLYKLTNLGKGRQETVAWNGKDASGRPVSAGSYSVYIRAIDRYGHSSLSGWNDFVVDYRRILVSLSQQKLWAFDGNQLVLTSLVTTGNRALPTPKGTFHILVKFHPFTFISPWPKTSQFYYKPSKVQYAMMFREGGYYIHDAPWRSAFGPGTNSQLGTPGTNYTGTHGCINVPPNVARELYGWTRNGTIVQVVA
jgi:lipoprotein-anchoring transpeptidase ErfK/SrfK